jgi:hypothetical protein
MNLTHLRFLRCYLWTIVALAQCSSVVHAQEPILVPDQGISLSPSTGVIPLPASQVMQAFVPQLSAVGYVTIRLLASNQVDNTGARIHVELRSDFTNGPVMARSKSVRLNVSELPILTYPWITFFFETNVTVKPGLTYYFEPKIEAPATGNLIYSAADPYKSGDVIINGRAGTGFDVFFVEGAVTPILFSPLVVQIDSPPRFGRVYEIRWDGGGILEQASELSGPWSPVTIDGDSAYIVKILPKAPPRFFRVRLGP